MSGYASTYIRIPKDDKEFEINTVVLFRELLNDPNVKRLGRNGQAQYGIDVIGKRDGDPKKIVGVQCKLKGPKEALTEDEVRVEVAKALKFSQPLSEYYIVNSGPNDTKLDALALKLSRQGKAKRINLRIEIWGWETLTERINEYESAKKAFDPGFSSSIAAQDAKLQKLIEGQGQQATAADVAAGIEQISDLIKQNTLKVELLPTAWAEKELDRELSITLQRRGFSESNAATELAIIADRVKQGDLQLAKNESRASVLERTARAHAQPETLDAAKQFHQQALKLYPSLNTSLFDAIILDAAGQTDACLRLLKQQDTPDALNAIFLILLRRKGNIFALDWVEKSDLTLSNFSPDGCFNILVRKIEIEKFEIALREVEALPASHFNTRPALYLVRANLRLASILPADQKHVVFSGMPINPRVIQFASDEPSQAKIKRAREDLEKLYQRTDDLRLVHLKPFLEELILWLKLEHPSSQDEARKIIAEEIKESRKTLRRVRLALAYDIPFNREALDRHLVIQKEVGNWTDDERFASFLLAFQDRDAKTLAAYFDQYRDELFSNPQLASGILAGIEIESLSRVGRFDDARKRIQEHVGVRIDKDEATHFTEMVAAVEAGNEAERLRKLFEDKGELIHLRLLVGALIGEKDSRQLSIYAPRLVRETKRTEDLQIALRALFAERKYRELVALCNELPQLYILDDDFIALKGWSLFHLGDVMKARAIARELLHKRSEPSDRELAVNTAIESGDWGYLQQLVAREVSRIPSLDYQSLIRLARLSQESASPYVDLFRDAAMEKAPDRPEPFLAAYQLSVDRGTEYQDSRTHEWFQKAVALSGPQGPIQHASLKDIVARAPAWNKKVDNIHGMLKRVEVPNYLAAKALNRQPIEYILGLALRNARQTDRRFTFPVLAFSGARQPVDLAGARTIAIDITALFTLEYLGLLRAIDAFDNFVIAPSTLSSLFFDRQFLKFRQPSEVTKARRIQQLIATGKLKILNKEPIDSSASSLDIDPELQQLLDKARIRDAIVIRSAPVSKVGSLLEDKVNLDSYSDVLADTHSVLKLLSGRIETETASNAEAYLKQVDEGWAHNTSINTSSTLYLDQLTVTYLDHVGILEKLASTVAAVWMPEEVEQHCQEVIKASDLSGELTNAVENIRSSLNAAIERGVQVKFSSRKPLESAESDESGVEERDPNAAFPTIDIMSDLTGVDVVICDDRMLNKEAVWSDGKRRVPCANTLDFLDALNVRGRISERQKFAHLHKLRIGGFYAVPLSEDELLNELKRASVRNGVLEETPELAAVRESLTIARRTQMYAAAETMLLDRVRMVIFQCIKNIWANDTFSSDTTAKADWLLAILPDPISWCADPVDEAQWAFAVQKLSGQIGMLIATPFLDAERHKHYGEWVENRLAKPTRLHNHWLWTKAFQVFVFYLTKMMASDGAPKNLRKALIQKLLDSFHPKLRDELFEDAATMQNLEIKLKQTLTINNSHSVDLSSLITALRAAFLGNTEIEIELADDSKVEAKLGVGTKGSVSLTIDGAVISIADADLLKSAKNDRRTAFGRIFRDRPVTSREEEFWSKKIESGLTDSEYAELLQLQRMTPESFAQIISAPNSLGAETMVPSDQRYFERLVGPIGGSDFLDYVAGPLKDHRAYLIGKGKNGLRRIAYSALAQSLIPIELLDAVSLKDIEDLVAASDPFTLIFGFEVCRDRLAKGDKEAVAVGKEFLERLFDDKNWLRSRCEIFAACTVITSTRVREVLNDPEPPVYWARLAAFSHAGVLTSALSGLAKPAEFYLWTLQQYGPKYSWQTAVDRREAPRWEEDFIDPASLMNELIGRCYNSTYSLSAAQRPKSWTKIVDAALAELDPKLLAFFPGPLDDFIQLDPTPQQIEGFKKVKGILRRKRSFKDAGGLPYIAYSGGINKPLSNDVMKLLERSEKDLKDLASAHRALECCAYIAGISRNEELAKTVVNKCLGFVLNDTAPDKVLQLFLVSLRACAAYSEPSAYYTAAGEVGSRFAYRVPHSAAFELRSALEIVGQRDMKMNAALSQAIALLEVLTVQQ